MAKYRMAKEKGENLRVLKGRHHIFIVGKHTKIFGRSTQNLTHILFFNLRSLQTTYDIYAIYILHGCDFYLKVLFGLQ